MNNALERWVSLRVADVMSRQVVTVSACQTMAEAAEVLSQHAISGVPVINEFEQCVGILSTSDFAKREHLENCTNTLATPAGEFDLVSNESEGPMHIEHVAANLVSQHMSCAPQTIDSERSLLDAARYMEGQHIHRLAVVDEHARPTGVISSLDLIAALVKSFDEQASQKQRKRKGARK